MQPLLQRIAIHGALAAIILAIVGLMFAELASIWLASSPAPTPAGGGIQVSVDVDVSGTLRKQVPLRMAVIGFAMVAFGETLLHFWRKGKPATAAKPASLPPVDAEKLLEQLLAESESRANAHAVPDTGIGSPDVVRAEPQSQPKI